VLHYLDMPPSQNKQVSLIHGMGIAPRDLLHRKGTPYAELGLDDPALTDAMMAHPILINRPIVFGPQA
jgi:arsenate reductase (glutaredoxin)